MVSQRKAYLSAEERPHALAQRRRLESVLAEAPREILAAWIHYRILQDCPACWSFINYGPSILTGQEWRLDESPDKPIPGLLCELCEFFLVDPPDWGDEDPVTYTEIAAVYQEALRKVDYQW